MKKNIDSTSAAAFLGLYRKGSFPPGRTGLISDDLVARVDMGFSSGNRTRGNLSFTRLNMPSF